MLRRSSRKYVTYTKDELENMKFLELKKFAKQRNLSRRFTTKHEIIDSLLNVGLENDLSMETLTLVDNSDSEHDNSTKDSDSKNPSPVLQIQPKRVVRKARRRFSKPRMTVFQLDNTENESNVTSSSDEKQKGNGRYFESPRTSVMTKSPEVSLNKSRASSAKKNKSVTRLLAGYCQTRSTTASPYPTRNRRSTRNFTPVNSATRSTRRTQANAESEQELYNTLNQSPYRKKYTAKKSFVTEPNKLELEARSGVFNKNPTTVETGLKYATINLEEQESSEENKTEQDFEINESEMSQIKSTRSSKKRSRFFKIEQNDSPVIAMKQDFVIDGLKNQESILSQSSVSPFEGTRYVRSGRRLRSRVISAEIKASPLKEAKVVEEESPKLDETFEIIEEVSHIDSPKVKLRERGNVSNLRSFRSYDKMSPSNELKTSKAQVVDEESPKHNETFEIIEEEVSHIHSPKVNLRQRGNARNLRSSRASDKMSPSNELKTSEFQDKSGNKENESTADLKLNGTYELPKTLDTTLPMLNEVSNSVKRRSRSFPRETIKKVDTNFFSPPKFEDSNKKSQKKGTPMKHTRIPVPKFKKVPDFQKIHEKEFKKMESLVDNHERKLQRAKQLATPNKVAVMVFKGAQLDKKDQLHKPAAQSSTGFQFNLHDRFMPNINIKTRNVRQSPQPVKYFIQKQNVREVKEIVTKKLPVHNRRENIREESRTKIRGVRLNRRFELQMAHRKIN